MADLQTAFCSPFGATPCALNFDVVPIYSNGGGDNRSFLGVVTIDCGDQLDGFSYRVFPATSTPVNPFETFRDGRIAGGYLPGHPLLSGGFGSTETQRSVTEGVVTDTNNMSFTFPVESLEHDYFVLVTPQRSCKPSPIQVGVRTNAASIENMDNGSQKPEFAIFYTSKVLKERKRRIKQRGQPTPVTVGPRWFQPSEGESTPEPMEIVVECPGDVELPAVPEVALPKFFKPRKPFGFEKTEEGQLAKKWIEGRATGRPGCDEEELGKRLKAMEEGRLHDDQVMMAAKASRRLRHQPDFAKAKVRYTEGTEFVPASKMKQTKLNNGEYTDMLPNDDIEKWADVYPQPNSVANTVNYPLRSSPPAKGMVVSPWVKSNFDPERQLEMNGSSISTEAKEKALEF